MRPLSSASITVLFIALLFTAACDTGGVTDSPDDFQVETIQPSPDWISVLAEEAPAGKGIDDRKFRKRLRHMQKVASRDLRKLYKQVERFNQRFPDATMEDGGRFIERLTAANAAVYDNIFLSMSRLAEDYPELGGMSLPEAVALLDAILAEEAAADRSQTVAGKEDPCTRACEIQYQWDLEEIDRAIYTNAISCAGAGSGGGLVAVMLGAAIRAAGIAGAAYTAICGWQAWLEIENMQRDADLNYNQCRARCYIKPYGG